MAKARITSFCPACKRYFFNSDVASRGKCPLCGASVMSKQDMQNIAAERRMAYLKKVGDIKLVQTLRYVEERESREIPPFLDMATAATAGGTKFRDVYLEATGNYI